MAAVLIWMAGLLILLCSIVFRTITRAAGTVFFNIGGQAHGTTIFSGTISVKMMERFPIPRRDCTFGIAPMMRRYFTTAMFMAISFIIQKWRQFVFRK